MTAPLLQADRVTFGYGRHREPVLTDWSADFRGGDLTALTGPSGRGKSTLLYLLGLMLRPVTGTVRVGGADAGGLPDAHRARLRAARFGFVFQDSALDHTRSVLDNVTEAALYRGQRRADLRSRAVARLDRFEVQVPPDRRPGQVSGGQAQRIALCRALLMEPEVLLADEPTGNLDPETARLVVQALQDHAAAGAAVVVVTHSPEVASACDGEIRL